MRHAVAAERDPVAWPVDAERPLTLKGRAQFRVAARGLRSLVGRVDAVLSSPYARAWETAQLLHEEAGWRAPESCEALTASDHEAVLAAIAARTSARSVVLVGHEPHLSVLATALLSPTSGHSVIEMRKGAAAYIEIGGPHPGSPAVLRWLLPPRVLRRLA